MFMICDWTTAGHECTRCAEPVQMGQELEVDIDATGSEGRVVWTVTHCVCPEVSGAMVSPDLPAGERGATTPGPNPSGAETPAGRN